jgi:hypothetical protein
MSTSLAGMAPVITAEVVRDYAAEAGVCVRPLLRKVTDRETGQATSVVIRCGSTRESKCPPCAQRARRLRMQQCAEGWHLEEDPLPPEPDADDTDDEQDAEPVEDLDGQDAGSERRVRSTQRRSDAVELPKIPAEHRTVGRTFTAPDGTVYRPSMFVTLTLDSYGKVIAGGEGVHVPGAGSPLHPWTYDYRRAAIEALFFTRLFDRWMQNLRRCAGYKVQYFGAIEPQRRLAPHIHLAMRGAIARATIRAVTKATYLQLWWPSFDQPVYTDLERLPAWDATAKTYRDLDTGFPLPTWDQALDDLDADPDAKPAVVMRFGSQVDIAGIIAPSPDADRAIRYLVKYLTKSVAETYTDPEHLDLAYEAHIDRLHDQVLYLPCSPECANWLRYGVQPKSAAPGLTPGMCSSKAHDRENLGLGGRRVQVSRAWSGKTLTEHKADRAAVVREVLKEAGIEAPDVDRMAADTLAADGLPRFVWEDIPVVDRDYVRVVMASVREAHRVAPGVRGCQGPGCGSCQSRRCLTGPVETSSATALPAASRQPAVFWSPGWLSRVSAANNAVTPPGALDRQTGD